ncbi:MAG: glycosyltransferase family 4 protein [Candidatus Omnitrophica bacterium]|nr:glycosyltransferase family 4 protein [Candidatus Omnitrophota bacterium]
MKVIIAVKSVYPFHPYGGVQKYVYYFAKHLAQKGINVEIVAPLDQKGPRTEEYEGMKYTFLSPSIYKYLEYPIGWLGVHLFSYSLAKYLKNKDFDILHSFDLTGYQYSKQKKRKPIIAHIFTDNYLCNPIGLSSVLDLTAVKFDKIKEKKITISPFSDISLKCKYITQYLFKIKPMYQYLSRAECIFCEADVFAKEVAEVYHLNSDKFKVVPVGVDLGYIQQQLARGGLSRSDLGYSDSDFILITVNRLAADKGIDKIILALNFLKQRYPQVRLIIIGAGYQEKEIYKIINENGLQNQVRHLKNIREEDLYQYYQISDAYICAFSFPGSSISTLEAMACSLPIITTAQAWLLRGRDNGIFLENNHPESITKAVEELIQQGSLKSKKNVSAEVVKDFDWKLVTEKAVLEYKKVIKNHK